VFFFFFFFFFFVLRESLLPREFYKLQANILRNSSEGRRKYIVRHGNERGTDHKPAWALETTLYLSQADFNHRIFKTHSVS
jgi:hypothetical protein